MEMGKLTAKLRDAVPVCFLVEGEEIKRYKNIEIPDELKKLDYLDFKFDVPLNGAITFKIMFEPGVLPEEFPQDRERRARKPREVPVAVVNEAPIVMPMEEAAEVDYDSTAIIDNQDYPIDEIPEVHAAGGEGAIIVEDQASEEITPATITINEAEEASTANPGVEMPKKVHAKNSRK